MIIRDIAKNVGGKEIIYKGLHIDNKDIIITGNFIKTAMIKEEWDEDIDNVYSIIDQLKYNRCNVDLFTFIQRHPDTKQRYDFNMEYDNIVAIPVITYDYWWKNVKRETRKCVRKAIKSGVIVKEVYLSDDMLVGIKKIYDELPIRQGKPFWHYNKDLETIKKEHSTYLDRSVFIGAYYKDELIGFIKIIFTDRYAYMINIIAMYKHRDKSPVNALIDKAVQVCQKRGSPYLTYGRASRGGLNDFKNNNGFKIYLIPRYYVPVSYKGKILLKFYLHHGIRGIIPEKILKYLIIIRAAWYKNKYKISGPNKK